MRVCRNLNTHKFVIIIVNVIGLIYLMVIGFLYIGTLPVDKYETSSEYYIYTKNTNLTTIDNLWELSSDLKRKGLIRSKLAFFAKAFIDGNYYHYKEREHELSLSMSADEIINALNCDDR